MQCCCCDVAGGSSVSSPAQSALSLAVKEALCAGKSDVLPALLQDNTANVDVPGGGWAGNASSRIQAALTAAEMNMKLRSKVSFSLSLTLRHVWCLVVSILEVSHS